MGISMKTTSGKLLASAGLIAAAASVAGLGTYGAFTGSTTATQDVAAGTVAIDLKAGSGGLNVPAADVLPGDTIERVVTLENTGTSDLGNVFLTTSTATPSDLTSDVANGLQLTIERCAPGWTGTAAPFSCATTPETVLASTAVIGVDRKLNNLQSVTSGKTDSLRVKAVLPATAGDAFQGDQSTVAFAFNATQRAAQTK